MRSLSVWVYIFLSFFHINRLKAQPYVDLINFRYTHAFKDKNANATPFNYLYIGSDLPLRFKNGTILLLSPFYENWNIDSAANKNFLPPISNIVLPVSIIFPLNDKFAFDVTAIPRISSEGLHFNNSFQTGGLVFVAYKLKEQQKLSLGVYMNNHFYGVSVIPLVGVDWRINKTNYLFGLLPGRLTFEHKLNNALYTGATFRAITNSYRLNNGRYLRIDDHQLALYLDYYPSKHLVVNIESGYGIFRKLREGVGHNKNYIRDYNWNDGMFIQLSASYRIRL